MYKGWVLAVFFLFLSSPGRAAFCGASLLHAPHLFPVHFGEIQLFMGQEARSLGRGGAAESFRTKTGGHDELVKDYFSAVVRDQDQRRLEIWQEVAEIIRLKFLKVARGSPRGEKQLVFTDVQGRDLESLLKWPALSSGDRKLLLARYERLMWELKSLVQGRVPASGKQYMDQVAWSHFDELGHGTPPGYLTIYYEDSANGQRVEDEILLKPSNVIVDRDLNFVIIDPH
jgi:hypothetical protein